MNSVKKLLVTFVITVLFVGNFGSAAYASDLVGLQTVQEATEDSNSNIVDTSATQTASDGEFVLEEGYFIDEQGQVYYDPTIITQEEIVIEDVADEDNSSDTIDDIKDETVKDSKKDIAKTQKNNSEAVVKKPSYTEAELRLLSCLVYAEAGNQSYNGMLGVANVVLNRVESDVFWHVNTIKEVIYDHKWSVQFSVTIKNSKTGVSALDKALKSYDTGKFTGS
ncbi:MAG: cell wall hydrolase, partial [Herbinix sp.]|nr:cell wall hydrolase [Herbinix sp.]